MARCPWILRFNRRINRPACLFAKAAHQHDQSPRATLRVSRVDEKRDTQVTAPITPQIVKQRVDQILALPVAERPGAIAALNQWLAEGMEQNLVEYPSVCAKVALSVLETRKGPK